MIDGALLLDKPVGLSSNRALQDAKKRLGIKDEPVPAPAPDAAAS